MDYQSILAHLNLWAVLPGLEDLVECDAQAAALAKEKNICISLRVRNGPAAYVAFEQGVCRAGRGKPDRCDVILFFTSCQHLNKMFDGQSNPIPLKGFTKIGFLTGPFQKLTDRLEYFLKPDDVDGEKDADYTAINTKLMMLTAGRAISVLSEIEDAGRAISAGIPDGSVLMKVLPDGPAVSVTFNGGRAQMAKGEVDAPMACMFMKNEQVANDLLNQKLDPFAAIAAGDVMIRGQIPMLDGMDLMLDRIGLYLE